MPDRILVVDDEPNMLRLLKTILMDKTGYEVTTTNNPLEVSKLLQEGHYDLVVTDLKMPWWMASTSSASSRISKPPCPSL